jgi:dolichol-phosphate mannosyltransferase
MVKSVLIIIPTFNEKENIEKIVEAIGARMSGVDVLIVDDNSPDGTGKIADQLSRKYSWVKVMHRKHKEGLGRAYVAGFKWGLERGYEKYISMDADFSHPIEVLPELIDNCNPKTVVIGSRYVRGGKIVGWSWIRYLNSLGANLITRIVLQIKAKDATAGFKCYPKQFLSSVSFDSIQSAGYAFQVEMLLLSQENNFKLKEIPITFADRVAGKSKIKGELVRSAKMVFRFAYEKKTYRQFAKFAIVGAINTLVDWAMFYLVFSIFKIDTQVFKQVAKAISFSVSAMSNYAMNRVWTFRSKEKRVLKEASKFFLVAIGGLAINQIVFYLATGPGGLRDIIGLILATASATSWNFIFNKKWTFKNL